MISVLFVCVQNSARSQMAEAYANALCGGEVRATSAGLEPGTLNELAVAAMREDGIDISLKQTKSVFDLYTSGALFNYVITVCDGASAEKCPIFAGVTKRLHWSFADTARFEGGSERKLEQTRRVRDEIRAKVAQWCADVCPVPAVLPQMP